MKNVVVVVVVVVAAAAAVVVVVVVIVVVVVVATIYPFLFGTNKRGYIYNYLSRAPRPAPAPQTAEAAPAGYIRGTAGRGYIEPHERRLGHDQRR